MAAQADIYCVSLGQTGLGAGVGVVAVSAIASSTGVLNFCGLDELGLVIVTGDAERLYIGLRQDYFSVLCWSVAHLAVLVCKRRVQKLGHQLGRGRRVRIVALQAIRCAEGLILMRFLQRSVFGIVTIDAQCGRGLCQMEAIFRARFQTSFVSGMAGLASHVECSVTATLFRNTQALRVAGETEIVSLLPGGRL